MMSPVLISRCAAVGIIVCGAAPAAAQMSEPAAPAGPRIAVQKGHVDLGPVRDDGVYDFSYLISNTGDSTLIIDRIRRQCGCTLTVLENNLLAPGTVVTLNASFDAHGRIGRQHKGLTVFSNDPAQPELNLTFEAEVQTLYALVPAHEPLPASGLAYQDGVSFTSLRPGERIPMELDVLAGSKADALEIRGIRVEPPVVDVDYRAVERDGRLGWRLTFAVAPGVPSGELQATALLELTAGSESAIVPIAIAGRVASAIRFHPPAIMHTSNSEALPPGAALPGAITLHAADGARPFEIRRVDAAGALHAEVQTVRPGLEYRVHLQVPESAAPGPMAAEVRILTDSPEQPQILVPVYAQVAHSLRMDPPAVYLRRPVDAPRASVQHVTVRATAGERFNIEQVIPENPWFKAAIMPRQNPEAARILEVSLADNAPPGSHCGVIKIMTDLSALREVRLWACGDVIDAAAQAAPAAAGLGD